MNERAAIPKLVIGTGFPAAPDPDSITSAVVGTAQSSSKHPPFGLSSAFVFEDCNHDVLTFSTDIDRQIGSILERSNALDSGEFNCIEYINRVFPTEQSLASADKVLEKLRHQIKFLDNEIKSLTRYQTDASQQTKQELEEVKLAIIDLVARIKTIKSKAAESECMVLEITHDIKSLDQAKRNLTHTITIFKRLQMFVNALDQLKGVANRKQYRETAHLLQVTLMLMDKFKGYKNVKQVASLCDSVAQFQLDIKRIIFNEFDSSLSGGTFKMQTQVLNDACLVVDVLGSDIKTQLIDWYCETQLKDYRGIFRTNSEVAGLVDISRRYAWLKRALKTHDEQHSALFLAEWRVAECFTIKFCRDTCKYLSEVLAKSEKDNTIDTVVMLQAINTTLEFEGKVDRRFTQRDYSDLVKSEHEFAPTTSKFYKIIASCFEPFLWHYIDLEDKALAEKFEVFKTQTLHTDEEAVLTSSTDLFLVYRQTLLNGARLSTRKPFLDLSQMFGKWLNNYNSLLLSKLHRDDKRVPTDDDLRNTCYIMNTADYCASTTAQLEEKLIEKIDEDMKGLLSLSAERESFMSCSASAVQSLVRLVENSTEAAFQAMIKRSWSTVTSVGDQSEHITMIAVTLSSAIKVIRRTIISTKYFRSFCDKFAESFTSKYLAAIYKCRPLSEVGAEQMLLDTYSLKIILTEMSTLDSDPPIQPPPAYIKILGRGITKIEQLLKVVLRPQDPTDVLVDTYNLLYQDYSASNFQRILELKGLRRSEMQPILDVFQIKIPAGTQPALPPPPPPLPDLAKGAMGNFKPDFRKFMNNINLKRS
ncbi:hypothetical protein BASA61_002999 [Batrachochytrium salamandrivorans]|nr:hypothetical protein BASA62_008867 [Batrachochytrium salamandrivorans]KAH6597906.1 hypothetical protein BASA61_002999 [Batrachochytrium salamandrivorans]